MRKKLFIFCVIAISFYARAYALKGHSGPAKTLEISPWLTGPLLSPSGFTIPAGHFNFEPYIYAAKSSHFYNSDWKTQHSPTFVSVQFEFPLQFGISKRWDCQLIPGFSWNHSKGQAKTVFNDLSLGVDYQLYLPPPDSWCPAIKLSLFETFPTGKYQHLDPTKLNTDIGGAGSYQTTAGISFGKLIHIQKHHWLSLRLAASFNYLAPVHAKGINAYGGFADTNGWEYPGNQFVQVFGFEYSFLKRFAFACDFLNFYSNKNRFSGNAGLAPPVGLLTPGASTSFSNNVSPVTKNMRAPSQNQISMAPALEYNWNANLGIITGAWFTIAGRNATDFFKWVVALNLYL